MSEFVPICSAQDLPAPGRAKECSAAGRLLCLANVDGEISVLDNVCPHREGPLGQGIIEEGKVVCPWHAWAFDPRSGQAAHNPAVAVRVFETRLEDGTLYARL
jgi:nitrite reductase (NADH) small subunit